MSHASEHPKVGTDLDEFDARAAEYALFQRTDLLPPRRHTGIFHIADKLGLRQSWDSFVRSHATGHAGEILRDYREAMRVEFHRRAPFIPDSVRAVLDVGCGLAGIDQHIYEYLSSNEPNLYLLDRSRVEERVWYSFEVNGAFYNSLELAKLNLIRSGVPENQIHCVEAPDDGVLDVAVPSVDLVISTISWGFHYPISTYIDSVARIMSNGGVLLVDIRKGTDGLKQLKRHFPESTDVVDEGEKHQVVKCMKG